MSHFPKRYSLLFISCFETSIQTLGIILLLRISCFLAPFDEKSLYLFLHLFLHQDWFLISTTHFCFMTYGFKFCSLALGGCSPNLIANHIVTNVISWLLVFIESIGLTAQAGNLVKDSNPFPQYIRKAQNEHSWIIS